MGSFWTAFLRLSAIIALLMLLSLAASAQTLTVSVQGTGSGTVLDDSGWFPNGCRSTCTADVSSDGEVWLTQLADDGSNFAGWTGCSEEQFGWCHVIMSGTNRTVTATFNGTPHTSARLTVIKQGAGNATVMDGTGLINCGTTCTADVTPGTFIDLLFALDPGSTWVAGGWQGCSSVWGDTQQGCTVQMTGDRTVYVTFNKSAGYTVTMSPTAGGTVVSVPPGMNCGSGGSACSTLVPSLSTVTFYAVPDAGNVFKSWTGFCATGNAANATTNPCLLMTGNESSGAISIGVNFGAPINPTVTALKGGTGSGSVIGLGNGINCGLVCVAEFASGTYVLLEANPSADSVFSNWTGCPGGGTGDLCAFYVNAPVSVTANFSPSPKIHVTKTGVGYGTVKSDVAGIDCGATCAANFGTSARWVVLTATPTLGSKVAAWGGACASAGKALSCNVYWAGANLDVSVQFDNGPMTLGVNIYSNGSYTGTVTTVPATTCSGTVCTGTFPVGTQVALTANPAANSLLGKWDDNYAGPNSTALLICSKFATGNCTLDLYSDYAPTASFTGKGTNNLAIVTSGTGSGVVKFGSTGGDCKPGNYCINSYGIPTSETLTATPNAGSTFTGWSGACTGTATTCTLTVTGMKVATANFTDSNTYPVTALAYGGGSGSVSGPTSAVNGTRVTLHGVPNPGSVFAGFTACPAISDCSFPVKGATTVGARFEPASTTYKLTLTLGGGGSGTVTSSTGGINCGAACAADYPVATIVTLTATPSDNSYFVNWAGGNGTCTTQPTCAVPIVSASTIYAVFRLKPTLSVTKTGTGTGKVTTSPPGIDCGSTCQTYYPLNTDVTITATPDPGSVFANWDTGCVGTSPTCTFPMNMDRVATARFEALRTLTVAKSGAGSGSITSTPAGINCGSACSATFTNNTLVTLTAVPAANNVFVGWQGCTSTTTSCSVTMDDSKVVTAIFDVAKYTVTVMFADSGKGTAISDPLGINCYGVNGQSCSAKFPYGSVVSIVGVADSGSYLSSIAGPCNGTDPCTFTVSGDTTVGIYFSPKATNTLQVVVDGTGAGSVAGNSATGTLMFQCGSTCGYSSNLPSAVTLTATPNAGSVFQGWQGGNCTTNPCSTQYQPDVVETAIFSNATAPRPSIIMAKGGFGSGTITSSPAGIACGSTCTAQFDSGTVVTLTPQADAGSTFTGWGGICASAGTGACSIRLWSLRNVTAYFSDPTVVTKRLTVTKDAHIQITSDVPGINCGGINNTCTADFPVGTRVMLTAVIPLNNNLPTYMLSGWTSPGACVNAGASTSCTLVMRADYTAGIRTIAGSNVNLMVAIAGGGSGTVVGNYINCPSTACAYGSSNVFSTTLTATASPGSTFKGWSGGCTSTAGATCTYSPTTSGFKILTATFEGAGQTLTVTKPGTGTGVVSSAPSGINCGSVCSASFPDGTLVTLTVAPDLGSVFDGWAGACSGTATTCNVSMDQAVDVTANLSHLPPQTITVTKTGSGTGTVSSSPVGSIYCGSVCSASFTAGQAVTLTAQPSAGTIFTGWSGGGCSGTGTCVVTPLNAPINVSANFDVAPPQTLTVTVAGDGTVTIGTTGTICSGTCSAQFTQGTSVTLTATPNPGSTLISWSGGGCAGTGLTCTVTMSTSASVTATFHELPRLTVTKVGVGTGTVTSSPTGINCGAQCAAAFSPGTMVYLTAAPDAGSTFVGWSGGCSGTGTCSMYFSTVYDLFNVTASFSSAVDQRHRPALNPRRLVPNGQQQPADVAASGYLTATGADARHRRDRGTVAPPVTHVLTVTKDSYAPVVSSPAGIQCGGSYSSCSATFDAGTVVTLTAQPWSGVIFNRWSGATACNVGSAPCPLAMDADYTITASYLTKGTNSNLFVILAGNGSGKVSGGGIDCPGNYCSYPYNSAYQAVLTANPDKGFIFTGWSGACTGTGTCTLNLSGGNSTVTATFISQAGPAYDLRHKNKQPRTP